MKNYLTISSAIVGSMAFVSIMPALMSAMMFDAPGSEENPATNAMFYSMFSFPLICILSIPLAWLLYAGSYLRAAAVAIWLCAVNVIVFAIAIICLEIFYDGKFNGHLETGVAYEFPLTGFEDVTQSRLTVDMIFRY